MDIKESPDHEWIDIHIERKRVLWITAAVLAGILLLVILTVDKVRELAERAVTPREYAPVERIPETAEIPEVYDIKGYAAASARAFERFLGDSDRRELYTRLQHFLFLNKVDGVLPSYQLLRQGSDWQKIDEPPFAIPPEQNWETMVDTLRVLQDEIIPRIGPVTVLSGWRTPAYNAKAGGSKRSKHMHFCGIDVVPERDYTREELIPILRDIHRKVGKKWNMGLGIYSGVRFHVDTCGYRRW
ncbi:MULTISPECIES: D-Ala-D-Ala carboxypeptidase family metallohydrolase [Microbulbifer]|uniref:D-Ala-D-Ala carboxypeptidase family metallohydrolase n=1 Tax=Microbulbifer TaxID=48073 RepID=UPI001E65B5F1|nr:MULTISPECIES: D-Ala-D-Ala carboxypeptidase family metallohydrolase [Microbulbifer]UHQ53800.1 D-Ala-D-Ala carboxypeptidase family metallohydrolase [Microbulbifer sp. YPW16]